MPGSIPGYQTHSNGHEHHNQGWEYEDYENGLGKNLSENSRIGFIRKVYMILSVLMMLTLAEVIFIYNSPSVSMFLMKSPGIMIATFVVMTVIMYALGCYKEIARSVPINYILLFVFAVAQSLFVGCICAKYPANLVLLAVALTVAVVVGLTIYAFTTDSDFTMCGGVLLVAGLVLLVATIVSMFVHNKILHIIISACGAVLFSIYLIYDTQLVVGKGENSLSTDDYIWGAMQLYIDIIQIFIKILQLLGETQR
jgi:protein lifeguard